MRKKRMWIGSVGSVRAAWIGEVQAQIVYLLSSLPRVPLMSCMLSRFQSRQPEQKRGKG